MKRAYQFAGAALLMLASLFCGNDSVTAGRLGGPWSTGLIVPSGQSVTVSITFAAGADAVVAINGTENMPLDLKLYDSDGHVAVGVGTTDKKTVTMNVYRTGIFRVEIRNTGMRNDTIRLMTN